MSEIPETIQIKVYEFRVHVDGRPTKGKVQNAMLKQIPQLQRYDTKAEQYMDSQYWTDRELDSTPGVDIIVHAVDGAPTMVVSAHDKTDVRDAANPIKTQKAIQQ